MACAKQTEIQSEYRTELKYIEAKEGMLVQWESKERAKVQEIIATLNTVEGQQYVVRLNKGDGR